MQTTGTHSPFWSPERHPEPRTPRTRSQPSLALPHLPEAAARVLQDFQGVVGALAFAVEFDVAGETFQFYLSKRDSVTAPSEAAPPQSPPRGRRGGPTHPPHTPSRNNALISILIIFGVWIEEKRHGEERGISSTRCRAPQISLLWKNQLHIPSLPPSIPRLRPVGCPSSRVMGSWRILLSLAKGEI